MKKIITTCLLASALSTSLMFGANAGPTSAVKRQITARVKFLTILLGLNANQRAEATTFFMAAATANAPVLSNLQAALQTLRNDMAATLPGAAPDTNKLQADTSAIGALEGQLAYTNAYAEEQFWSILTSDQQNKFRAYEDPGDPNPDPNPGVNDFRGSDQ